MSRPLPTVEGIALAFATPRKLPQPARLGGRVVVVDIAFAAEGGGQSFAKTTGRFIERLGARLVAWIDHHDSRHHRQFASDPRFVLARKAEHGACPEMISPQLVSRFAWPDTIVCHVDFDGLASAAKWIRGGREPYSGCDADARAIDTCLGRPSPTGATYDRALRARPGDRALLVAIVQQLVGETDDPAARSIVDGAAGQYAAMERRTAEMAAHFEALTGDLVLLDATGRPGPYDKTLLLLLGQKRATMAAVIDGDTVTFAAGFDSGVDFLERLSLSGGMPTRVSIRRAQLGEALLALGVPEASSQRWVQH